MNSHRNCETGPCQLCARRQRGETCGSCHAGILVGVNDTSVQRCDECALFETDADAVESVRALTKLLHQVYRKGIKAREGFTVADAMSQLVADVKNAPVLRMRANRILIFGQGDHQELIDFARDLRGGC